MNPSVERVALRCRSWLMARRRTPGPGCARRLRAWARRGSGWRWLVAGPAVVVVLTSLGAWWLAAQVAGFAAILGGWSPPLNLAGLDTAAPFHPPEHPGGRASDRLAIDEDEDPAAWNFNHDPWARLQREQLAVQREYLAELRLQREARATEAPTTPAAAPEPASGQVPSYWWPPAAPRRRRRPVRVVHALMVVAVVAGLAWCIGAFSLGVASSAGWIRQPPMFTQLDTPRGPTP